MDVTNSQVVIVGGKKLHLKFSHTFFNLSFKTTTQYSATSSQNNEHSLPAINIHSFFEN